MRVCRFSDTVNACDYWRYYLVCLAELCLIHRKADLFGSEGSVKMHIFDDVDRQRDIAVFVIDAERSSVNDRRESVGISLSS